MASDSTCPICHPEAPYSVESRSSPCELHLAVWSSWRHMGLRPFVEMARGQAPRLIDGECPLCSGASVGLGNPLCGTHEDRRRQGLEHSQGEVLSPLGYVAMVRLRIRQGLPPVRRITPCESQVFLAVMAMGC